MPETQGNLATPEELTTWWQSHFTAGPMPVEGVADSLQDHWAIRWKNGRKSGKQWTTMPVSRDRLCQELDVDGTSQTGSDAEEIIHRLCEHMAFLNFPKSHTMEGSDTSYVWHNDADSGLRISSHTSVDGTRKSALLRLIDHKGRHSQPTIVGPTGAAFIASHMLLCAHGPDMIDPASVPALNLTHDQVRQTVRRAADQAQDSDEATELVADAVWELVAPRLAAAGLGEVVDTARLLRDLDQTRRDLDSTRTSLEVAQYEYEQLRTSRPQIDGVGPY